MTDAGLAEEVGPPSPGGWIPYEWIPLYYTVYEVPRKIMQGRDPSMMEWMQAAIDPVFLVMDIVSVGESKVVRETVAEGRAHRRRKGAEKAWVTTLARSGLELPTRQLDRGSCREAR